MAGYSLERKNHRKLMHAAPLADAMNREHSIDLKSACCLVDARRALRPKRLTVLGKKLSATVYRSTPSRMYISRHESHELSASRPQRSSRFRSRFGHDDLRRRLG